MDEKKKLKKLVVRTLGASFRFVEAEAVLSGYAMVEVLLLNENFSFEWTICVECIYFFVIIDF